MADESGTLSSTIFSLLDASEDRDSDVRNACLNALSTIGSQHLVAATSLLLQYRSRHKTDVGEYARSAVWACMTSIATSKTDLKSELGIDVFNDLVTAAAEDVNRERASSEPALTFLLKCCPRFIAEVLNSLLYLVENYSSNIGSHAPTLPLKLFDALDRIFSQNAQSALSYVGRLLSVLVSIVSTGVKVSKDRIRVADTLQVLADVMQENTTTFEREINSAAMQPADKQQPLVAIEATLAADQQQFNRCYVVLLNDWLPHAKSSDAELQCALINAFGALAVVISIEKLTDTAVVLHKASIDLLKRHSDNARCCTGAINCLYQLTLCAPKMLEPHIDMTLDLLFDLACHTPDFSSPSAIKAHNEIVRGYTVLGRYFTDRAFSLLLQRLDNISKITRQLKHHLTSGEQNPQEVIAVGALGLLNKLLQFPDIQVRPVLPAIVAMIKKATAVNAPYPFTRNAIKHALLLLLLTFADANAVDLTTANFPVEIIVRCCVMPLESVNYLPTAKETLPTGGRSSATSLSRRDSPSKLAVSKSASDHASGSSVNIPNNNQTHATVTDAELCDTARNTLALMCEAVAATQRILWPSLFLFLMPAQYSRAADVLAKSLRRLALLPAAPAVVAESTSGKSVEPPMQVESDKDGHAALLDRLAILADYGDSSVPTPPALFARLFILCGSRWPSDSVDEYSNSSFYAERARNCLLLMTALMPVLRSGAQAVWQETCQRLLSTQTAPDAKEILALPLIGEKKWQEEMLKLLSATLSVDVQPPPSPNDPATVGSHGSQWPDLLAQSLAQQISTYTSSEQPSLTTEFTAERLYLYATLATVLIYIPSTDEHASSTVGKCLDLMLNSTRHEDVKERTWLACAVGKVAQMHMETVLNKLGQFEKSYLVASGGKGGSNQGFLRNLFSAAPSSPVSISSSNIFIDSGSDLGTKLAVSSSAHLQATVILCYGCVVQLFSPAEDAASNNDGKFLQQETLDTDDGANKFFPSTEFGSTATLRTFAESKSDFVESLRQVDTIARHICQAYLLPQADTKDTVVNFSLRHALCCFAKWYAVTRSALLFAIPSSLLTAALSPTEVEEQNSPRVAVRNGGSRTGGIWSRVSTSSLQSSTPKHAKPAVVIMSPEAVVHSFVKIILQYLRIDAVLSFEHDASTLRLCALSALTQLVRLDLQTERMNWRFQSTTANVVQGQNSSSSTPKNSDDFLQSNDSLGADKVAEIRSLLEICLHEVLTLAPPGAPDRRAQNGEASEETNNTAKSRIKLLEEKRPSAASVTITSSTTTYVAVTCAISVFEAKQRASKAYAATVAGLKELCTTLLHLVPTPVMFQTFLDLLTPYIESDAECEQQNALSVLNGVLSQMEQQFPSFVVEPVIGRLFALLAPRCFDAVDLKATNQYAVFCMLELLKYTSNAKSAPLDEKGRVNEEKEFDALPEWCKPFVSTSRLDQENIAGKSVEGQQLAVIKNSAVEMARQICRALLKQRGQQQLVNFLLGLTSSAFLDADRPSSVAGSVFVVEEVLKQIREHQQHDQNEENHESTNKQTDSFLIAEHVRQLIMNIGIAHRYVFAAASIAASPLPTDLVSGRASIEFQQTANISAENVLPSGYERCIAALALVSRESLQQCCDTLVHQPLPFDVTVCRCWFTVAEAVSMATSDAEIMRDVLIERVLRVIVDESQYAGPYADSDEQQTDGGRYQFAKLSLLQHLCALLEILRVPLIRQRVLGFVNISGAGTATSDGCEKFVKLFTALTNIVQALVSARPARTPRDKFLALPLMSPGIAGSTAADENGVKKSSKSLPRLKWLKLPVASATKTLVVENAVESTQRIIDGDISTAEEWQRVVHVRPITVAVDALREVLRCADFPVRNFNWLTLTDVETCDIGLELIVSGVVESLASAPGSKHHYDLKLFVQQVAQRCSRSLSSPVESYRIAGAVMLAAVMKTLARQSDDGEHVWTVQVVSDAVNALMTRLQNGGGSSGPGDPNPQVRRWCVRALAALATTSPAARKLENPDDITGNRSIGTRYVNDIYFIRCFIAALDDRDEWSSPIVAVEACDALRDVLMRTTFANVVDVCNSCATKLKPLLNLDVHSTTHPNGTNINEKPSVGQSSVIVLLHLQKLALLAFAALVQRFGNAKDGQLSDELSATSAGVLLVEHIQTVLIPIVVRTAVSPPQQKASKAKPDGGESGSTSWPSSVSGDHDGSDIVNEDFGADVPDAALHCLRCVLPALLLSDDNSINYAATPVELDHFIPSVAVSLFKSSSSSVLGMGTDNTSPFMQMLDAVFERLFSGPGLKQAAENHSGTDQHDADKVVRSEKLRRLCMANAANLASMASTSELRSAAVLAVGSLLTVSLRAGEGEEKLETSDSSSLDEGSSSSRTGKAGTPSSRIRRKGNEDVDANRATAIALVVKLLKDPEALVRKCAAVSVARIFKN